MKISEKLQGWELEKALYLIKVANQINMEFSEYTIIGVNNNSGYVYLFDDNYNFTLYMPFNCDLIKGDVYAQYTDFDNGEEYEIDLSTISDVSQIENWINKIINL
jgi:uncharacterized protein (DUF302 family)